MSTVLEALELPDVTMVVFAEMPYELILEYNRLTEYIVEAVLLPKDTYVEVVTVTLPEAKDEPEEVPVGAVVAVDVSVTKQSHCR